MAFGTDNRVAFGPVGGEGRRAQLALEPRQGDLILLAQDVPHFDVYLLPQRLGRAEEPRRFARPRLRCQCQAEAIQGAGDLILFGR